MSSSLSRLAARLAVAFVVFMVGGNLAIVVVSQVASRVVDAPALPDTVEISGIDNLQAVDAKLLRGAAPSATGYRSLATAGVTTIIDLRAEQDAVRDDARVEDLGMRVVHLPVRDGQVPSQDEVDRVLATVEASPGLVFMHCGAGVGRAGATSAAYLVATGQAAPREALRQNLAVGPPSLEQIAFVAGLADGAGRPNPILVGLSRTLDAPRRLWSRAF